MHIPELPQCWTKWDMFTTCSVIPRKSMARENWPGSMSILWHTKLFWPRKAASGRTLCMPRPKHHWPPSDMSVTLSTSTPKKHDSSWMTLSPPAPCSRLSGYPWRWTALCPVGRRETIRFVWPQGWCAPRWFKLEGVGTTSPRQVYWSK